MGRPRRKRFWVSLEGAIERDLPCGKGLLRSTVVDAVRRQVGDPTVAVLGVVPREEGPAESLGGLLAGESGGEARVVLEGLELGLGIRGCRHRPGAG